MSLRREVAWGWDSDRASEGEETAEKGRGRERDRRNRVVGLYILVGRADLSTHMWKNQGTFQLEGLLEATYSKKPAI